jgi:hypothetical protein
MKTKNKTKKSTKMLIGAGIFLTVYLLVSILFGSSVVKNHAIVSVSTNNFSRSVFSF